MQVAVSPLSMEKLVERIRFKFISHLKNYKSFMSFVVESYSKIQYTPLFVHCIIKLG